MYEEKKFIGRKVNWLSVLLKLCLLFLIVFLVWYFIFRNTNRNNKDSHDGKTMTENLKYLKKEYVKYFNEDNMPKYINERVKVSLDQLVNAKYGKIIYDKNGDKCSHTSSYGQLTKVDEDSYDLKVYLKCKNEADSSIATLSKENILNNSLNTNKKQDNKDSKNNDKKNSKNSNDSKTNKDTNVKDTKNTNDSKDSKNSNQNNNANKNINQSKDTSKNSTNNNNNNNNNSKNSNTSSNSNKNVDNSNNQNSTSKNKSNGTSNSSSSTISENGGANNNQNSTSETKTITEKDIDVETIISDPSRIVFTEYHMIKLGDITLDKPENGKYITDTYEIKYYKYCVGNDTYNCNHNFAKTKENEEAIKILIAGGFKEYYDYSEYIKYYVPILDDVWSKDKDLAGYTYAGESRTHYSVN